MAIQGEGEVGTEEAEMALPEGDTRHLRYAATHRSIRYWNAYVKSGCVRKILYRGEERVGGHRRWHWRPREARPDDELRQSFDGDLRADDYLTYSLNKKQRWRLMDAFEESLADDVDENDEADDVVDEESRKTEHAASSSKYDVSVALTDRVKFGPDCRRVILKTSASADNRDNDDDSNATSAPQIRESVPNHRYERVNNALATLINDDADMPGGDGRDRRRARGRRDGGRLVKTQPKIPGHARRCNCGRCAAQSERAEWRSTAQLVDEGLPVEWRKRPQLVDEIRYIVEAPVQKSLVTKRAITCEKYHVARDKVVKGKRNGKSALELAEELEEDFEEEEEEELVETDEEQNAMLFQREYSLAEWMTSNLARSPRTSGNDNISKQAKNSIDTDQIDKPHIRYLNEGGISSSTEDFVIIDAPKSTRDSGEKQEEEEEQPLATTQIILPSSTVEPEHLQQVFGDAYFEADSIPRTFVVDVSDEVTTRLEADQRESLKAVFRSVEEGIVSPVLLRAAGEKKNEPMPPKLSRRKKRRRQKKDIGSHYSHYYLPTPHSSSKKLDVNCFLVFKERPSFQNDSEEEVSLEVSLNADVDCREKFPLTKENDMNNNSFTDMEDFILKTIEGITQLSKSQEQATVSSGRSITSYTRFKSKVRINKGIYQSVTNSDDIASGVNHLNPKDVEARVKKDICKTAAVKESEEEQNASTAPLNEEAYCNICWMPINTTSATALSTCASQGHWFCDACWRSHLRTQVDNGASALTCPEFDCSNHADFATMLRLLPWKRCNVFLRRLEDRMIVDGDNSKWCPATGCGCALVVDADVLAGSRADECLPVSCSCGLVLCFHCLGEQHSPATCEESAKFREARVKNGHEIPMFDGSYLGESESFVAKVKPCPHCHRKMEKGEGCNHMSCACGKDYCWSCGKDFNTAHYEIDANGEEQWIGCQMDKDLEEVVLEEMTAGSEDWYAKAMRFRRHRRTTAWSKFNLKKFLALDYVQKIPYKKTEDIVKQYEMLTESRRRLHQLVRDAFETVVETLQILEYLTVANHFRFRRRQENVREDEGEFTASSAYLTNHVWFFVSRLIRILNDGPKSKVAVKVAEEIEENLAEIKDAIVVLKLQLE